MLDDKVF